MGVRAMRGLRGTRRERVQPYFFRLPGEECLRKGGRVLLGFQEFGFAVLLKPLVGLLAPVDG